MASRKRGSRTRKRRSDPGQLNLFDTPGEKAPVRAKSAAPLRVKTKRLTAAAREQSVILSPREAAAYLRVAVSTLKSWRAKKIGPKWMRRGARLVCYFPEDLDAFLRRGARDPDKP
ncbi:helix-turn-helix transcriptional regulator [Vitreimonas flagellata]|uniref:helix-turn-helix transcriptional regulator n=1 Tax=Vitreimonas flagellata TaxID=2560861 RepID=UPI00107584F3|nr:helix-turn-helix domain-containing protein [Vitreimonas flagellata]